MTIDEDAVKVVNECSVPASPSEPCVEIEDRWKDELKRRVAAYGRRCAESMREECAEVAENGRFLHDDAPDARFGKACAQAIRRVEVK